MNTIGCDPGNLWAVWRRCRAGILLFLILITILWIASCQDNDFGKGKEPLMVGEIQCGTDDPIFFYNLHDMVRTEEGYYFITDQSLLCFFDPATQVTVPVCSRPNCMHAGDDPECDADMSKINQLYGLCYYDDEIYVGAYDVEKYQYYLCRISKDGRRRTRCCTLLSMDPGTTEYGYSGNTINTLVIHRGYAYFTAKESETKITLFRVALDRKAKPETIHSIDGDYLDIDGLRGYHGKIYFNCTLPFNDTSKELRADLFSYDITTGDVEKRMEGLRSDYFPGNDNIYCLTETDFCMLAPGMSVPEPVFRNDGYRIFSYDGRYFYFDNIDFFDTKKERAITVTDSDGTIVDKIVIDNGFYCLFGDQDYLFCYWRGEDSLQIRALDKKQIGTGSHTWIVLDPEE